LNRSNAVDHEVRTDDGVRLHVRVEGAPDAEVTVVLCHGFGMNSASWCFQRAALAKRARVVTWDQRGHGRSGYGPPGSATMPRLGRDLRAVLDHCAPEGPVVLAGHSMGGMTIMALAAEHPELFGERILGVVLVATSAGPVGIPSHGVLPGAVAYRAVGQAATVLEPALRLLRRLPGNGSAARELIRRFGLIPQASGSVLDILDIMIEMLLGTTIKVMTEVLFPCFRSHDKLVALNALRRVSTLVLVGERDAITPLRHSRQIAAAVPGADLVVVPNAGHILMLERPVLVNEWLRAMVTPFWTESEEEEEEPSEEPGSA
jgi:pimeloyl-ACP methyl ester carboxylesterase